MGASIELLISIVSRGSIDAWGQQLTNFMTFVVVLMCEGF
jgi:hypothetical protein